MKKPCYMCNNALVDEELRDDNDYGCFCIGDMPRYKRIMLCTGWGRPLRIEYDEWNDQYGKWSTAGCYYPKYCPNCGREIVEYKIGERGRSYERNR